MPIYFCNSVKSSETEKHSEGKGPKLKPKEVRSSIELWYRDLAGHDI